MTSENPETDRLRALASYEVMDTPPEPGFDDLAALAAELCDAPIAFVTFVDDDHQFFKASVGFSGGRTAPLDTGFCPLVVEAGRPLVIPDAGADPAHSANPAVREGGVRFYAGVPLLAAEGQALGTLCVLSPDPRPAGLAPGQMRALRALADQAMTQLAYRRSVRARDAALADQRATIHLQDAFIAAQAGVAAAVDLEAVLDTVIAAAMEAVPAAEGGVIELGGGDRLEYVAVRGNLVAHRGLTVPLHGSVAGHCWRTRQPSRVPDVRADPHVKQDLVERLNLRSCVLAPIERDGKVTAVLKLQSSRADAFTDRDLQSVRSTPSRCSCGRTG